MAILSDLTMELSTVSFSAQDSKSITFTQGYSIVPTVIVTPQAGVNTYIKNLTVTGCTIATSNTYTGNVKVHVIGR